VRSGAARRRVQAAEREREHVVELGSDVDAFDLAEIGRPDSEHDVGVGAEQLDRVDLLAGVVSGDEALDDLIRAVANEAGLDALPNDRGGESGGHRLNVVAS